MIHANQSQSRILADLRDTLLPKLLSGEIRVGEAEAQLGSERPTMSPNLTESVAEEETLRWFEELGYSIVVAQKNDPGARPREPRRGAPSSAPPRGR